MASGFISATSQTMIRLSSPMVARRLPSALKVRAGNRARVPVPRGPDHCHQFLGLPIQELLRRDRGGSRPSRGDGLDTIRSPIVGSHQRTTNARPSISAGARNMVQIRPGRRLRATTWAYLLRVEANSRMALGVGLKHLIFCLPCYRCPLARGQQDTATIDPVPDVLVINTSKPGTGSGTGTENRLSFMSSRRRLGFPSFCLRRKVESVMTKCRAMASRRFWPVGELYLKWSSGEVPVPLATEQGKSARGRTV